MSKSQRVMGTLLIIGLVGIVAGIGTFAAFSSSTSNDGNVFAAGTVYISDNDLSSAMYNVSNKKPGGTATGCIKVTYTGSLPADVKLYWTPNGSDNLSQYITADIDKVTYNVGQEPTFPNCGTPASSSNLYSGNLSALATTYGGGIAVYPGSQTQWDQNDAVWFRFTLTLQDNANANGQSTAKTTGAHSFTWEARNQ